MSLASTSIAEAPESSPTVAESSTATGGASGTDTTSANSSAVHCSGEVTYRRLPFCLAQKYTGSELGGSVSCTSPGAQLANAETRRTRSSMLDAHASIGLLSEITVNVSFRLQLKPLACRRRPLPLSMQTRCSSDGTTTAPAPDGQHERGQHENDGDGR